MLIATHKTTIFSGQIKHQAFVRSQLYDYLWPREKFILASQLQKQVNEIVETSKELRLINLEVYDKVLINFESLLCDVLILKVSGGPFVATSRSSALRRKLPPCPPSRPQPACVRAGPHNSRVLTTC